MPKVGEVYRDNYPYEIPRFVRVLGPAEIKKRDRRVRGRIRSIPVQLWEVETIGTGRKTKIAEDRFKASGKTGYTLVEREASDA